MRTLLCFVVSLLISIAYAQSFTSSFFLNDPNMQNGFVYGTINYRFAPTPTYSLTFKDLDITETYLFNTEAGYVQVSDQTQFTHGSCACSQKPITTAMPVFHLTPEHYGLDRTPVTLTNDQAQIPGFATRSKNPKNPVAQLVLDSKDVPIGAIMKSGRRFLFTKVEQVDNLKFDLGSDCKEKQCSAADVVFIVDTSVSVKVAFAELRETLKKVAATFSPKSDGIHLGIIQFDWDTSTILSLKEGVNSTSVERKISQFAYPCPTAASEINCKGTCVSCGMRAGVKMLNEQGRKDSAKVLVVVTDGYHNLVWKTDSPTPRGKYDANLCIVREAEYPRCSPALLADLRSAADIAATAFPNIEVYTVGVLSGKSGKRSPMDSDLQIITRGNTNHVMFYNSWADFSQHTELTKSICDLGTPTKTDTCGTSCCGLCTSCGCKSVQGCLFQPNATVCQNNLVTDSCCRVVDHVCPQIDPCKIYKCIPNRYYDKCQVTGTIPGCVKGQVSATESSSVEESGSGVENSETPTGDENSEDNSDGEDGGSTVPGWGIALLVICTLFLVGLAGVFVVLLGRLRESNAESV